MDYSISDVVRLSRERVRILCLDVNLERSPPISATFYFKRLNLGPALELIRLDPETRIGAGTLPELKTFLLEVPTTCYCR